MRLTPEGRLGEVRARLGHIPRALRLIRAAAGGWTAGWVAILIAQGLIPAGIVYVTRWLVDALAEAVAAGLDAATITSVVMPALVMGGLIVAQQGLQSLLLWVQTAQSERVQDHIKDLIHRKAVEVDFGFYESPEYFDKLQQANSAASTRTLSMLQDIGTIGQNLVTFVSIAAILVTYSVWLPLVLLAGTLPAIYVVVAHNRRYHGWWKRRTRDRRWAQYLDLLFMQPHFAAEMRLYDLGAHFREQYRTTRDQLRTERIALIRRQALANLGAAAVALLVTAGIMVWIVLRALAGQAQLGDIALFYQAVNQGQGMVRSLLSSVGRIYSDTLFLDHLFGFLSIQPELERKGDPLPVPSAPGLDVAYEGITFTYPGSEGPAVRDLTLQLPSGELTAIVGANGAGKSTLLKLLCRFYDPDSGTVRVGGVDIRELDPDELRRQISVMFQAPVHFQATVLANILIGDRTAERTAVLEAARESRASEFIEHLPQGYDTLLGRLFEGGRELSAGEWQRIALARAYLRQSPIIALDEPTSAMDSWTELRWLEGFRRLVRGRTALVITHRFTTARQADMIHVMDEGRIIESGSHEELVERGGLYAASWRAQTERQRDEAQPATE